MRPNRVLTALIALSISCAGAAGARAAAPFEETIQYALERLTSGTAATAKAGDTTISVVPIRTWKSVSGHYCREYQVTVAKPDSAVEQEVGTRCREADGIWKRAK